jgi:hypothetical protein
MNWFLPEPEGSDPNARRYELTCPDGGVWRYQGKAYEYDLRQAIALADHVAGQEGRVLYVTDPETGTVLWTGQAAR